MKQSQGSVSGFAVRLAAWFAVLLASWSIVGGCDRAPEARTSPAAESDAAGRADASGAALPATPPAASLPVAATTPATQPPAASVEQASSFMMIDQQRVDFPAARLRVLRDDGRVVASLFSDDPPDAISDSYTGNSFYFQMPLSDVDEPADFLNSTWRYAAGSVSERDDTPYGVFLGGRRQQLQPLDVKVDFDPVDSNGEALPTSTPTGLPPKPAGLTTVWLSGQFLLIDNHDPNQPPRTVSVAARLIAKTAVK